MPVDKQVLKDTLREAAGDDGELYALLEQKMLANDNLAAKFVGGFMRDRDYRSKTQALANDRQTWEGERQTVTQQIDQYRQLLEAAEKEKGQVLSELGKHRESLQGAYARLQHIKQVYQLSDDDIPSYKDLIQTEQKGKPVDSSTDIDEKLTALEKKITGNLTNYLSQKLVPELGGMAHLDIVWPEIREEHLDLTGKRMTAKQMKELLDEANKRGNVSLQQLWEEKYDVATLHTKKHDGDLEKTLREKWEAEQTAKRSEEALAGLHPTPTDQAGLRTSQILGHKFKVHEEAEPQSPPKLKETPSAVDRQSMSGAERASRRYLERRANGVPMGAPDERKPTKAA